MTLALRTPDVVHNIVAVDNAPIDTAIGGEFAKYIRGMKKIDEADVAKQADADKILIEYEEVRTTPGQPAPLLRHELSY